MSPEGGGDAAHPTNSFPIAPYAKVLVSLICFFLLFSLLVYFALYAAVRDPLDVFFSFYNFLPPYMGIAPDAISHDEFADAIFAGASHSGHVWQHFLVRDAGVCVVFSFVFFHISNFLLSRTVVRVVALYIPGYFDQRHRPEVLLVCFEDLKENLVECVDRIARHMVRPGGCTPFLP